MSGRVARKQSRTASAPFASFWDKAKAWKHTAETAYDGLSLPEWEKEEQPCFPVDEIAHIIERSPQPYNTVWRLVAETGRQAAIDSIRP
jgi:hypothetical protein